MSSPDVTRNAHRTSAGRAGRREIRALTGLRIVAALWVVAFHFHFTPGETYTAAWQFLRPVIDAGALGVDLFFVLSGFVITLTYLDSAGPRLTVAGTRSFLWARISRIWPVHVLVTTVFGGWLAYKATRVSDGYLAYQTIQPQVDLPHYLEQLLMVQLWHRPTYQGASWVGPAWSLSAEWLAYVSFPVVVLVLWRLRNAPVLVTGALAVGCLLPAAYLSVAHGALDFPFAWLLRIAGGFLAGALTCLTVRRLRTTPGADRLAGWCATLAVLLIAAGLWWADWRGQGTSGSAWVVAPLFPVLVGALALSTSGPARLLATRPMVHGGRISFALYLVHIPVFEAFWTFMQWHPRMAPGTVVGTVATPLVFLSVFVLAHLVHRFVEEPAHRALRRREPGRPVRAGDAVEVPGTQEQVLPAPRETADPVTERV
jgi:peptidoglycan/LPS O-acetylase OafA/YrhL